MITEYDNIDIFNRKRAMQIILAMIHVSTNLYTTVPIILSVTDLTCDINA